MATMSLILDTQKRCGVERHLPSRALDAEIDNIAQEIAADLENRVRAVHQNPRAPDLTVSARKP